VILQIYLATMVDLLRHEKHTKQELLLETNSDDMTVTETLILTLRVDMMKTVLVQAVQVGAKFMSVQDHRTNEIVMVSILSLEVHLE